MTANETAQEAAVDVVITAGAPDAEEVAAVTAVLHTLLAQATDSVEPVRPPLSRWGRDERVRRVPFLTPAAAWGTAPR